MFFENICLPLLIARLRLNPSLPIGEITINGGGSDLFERGSEEEDLVIGGDLDELTDYFALLDNGAGVVAEVGVLWNSTLDYFYIDADDLELDSLLPAGRYSLRVFKTADGVYSSSGSGEAVLTIGRLVFLHYGLGGPVLGTGANWRGHLEQRLPPLRRRP